MEQKVKANSVVSFPEERIGLLVQFAAEVESTDPQSPLGGKCLDRYNALFQGSVTEAGSLQALQQLQRFAPPNKKAADYLQRKIRLVEAAAANTPRSRVPEERRSGNWPHRPDLAEA